VDAAVNRANIHSPGRSDFETWPDVQECRCAISFVPLVQLEK
jgi:hypothetical protein